MRKISSLVLFVATVFAAAGAAADQHMLHNHKPGENCWGTPADTSKIAELRKTKILFQADHPYSEIFTVLQKFVPEPVEMLYDNNPEFNAYAHNWGNRTIVMQLGVSTQPLSTIDASAMVACHELGHHFGGQPAGWGGMSVEGQSDYYAVQECFKHWVDNSQPFDPKNAEVESYCKNVLGRNDTLCVRSLAASLNLTRIIAELKKHTQPLLTEKDPSVVSRTQTGHPVAQCRLDTYKAGYQFLDSNKTLGENRPFCWFKPAGPALLSLAGF